MDLTLLNGRWPQLFLSINHCLSVIYVLQKTEKTFVVFTFSAHLPLLPPILAVQPLEMLNYIERMKEVEIIL